MPTILYVYEDRIPEALRAFVRSYFPRSEFELVEMSYAEPLARQKEKVASADAILCAPGRFLADEVLFAARRARLIQLWSSGFDKFNVAGATAAGIPVATNGGANASSVAEHAVLLMLAVSRRLPEMDRKARSGSWGGSSYGLDMQTLEGKCLGIVGFGNIGKMVAQKVLGFGMEVRYFDTCRAALEEEKRLAAAFLPFDELLNTADIVTLHLHANSSTKNILNTRSFSLLKKGALLINTARAELVEKEALCTALQSGALFGAGLDVFEKEPPLSDDPFFSFPTVVATPHSAGSNRDAYARMMEHSTRNIRRALAGEEVCWSVNGLVRLENTLA